MASGIGSREYTDSTHLTLENNYSAVGVSNGAFTIGEMPNLPTELHTTLYDYAMWRYQLGKRNQSASTELKQIWEQDLETFGELYDGDVEQQVFQPTTEYDITTNLMQVPENVA